MEPNNYLFYRFVHDSVFTPEECRRIIDQPGQILSSTAVRYDPDSEPDVYRDHTNAVHKYIEHNEENAWLVEGLAGVIYQSNLMYYNFDIQGLMGTRVFAYKADSFMAWHVDIGVKLLSLRKISAVVFLSDPGDYAGGKLRWFPDFPEIPQEQGSVVLFPSFIPHQVEPVTRGVRYTLVTWAHGPAFR